jgi:hypothetical protein
VLKVETLELFWWRTRLREDELEFLTRGLPKLGAGFGTDADPINLGRRRQRAIGLDSRKKLPGAHRIEQFRVELEQRFAAGEDDEAPIETRPPCRRDGIRKHLRRRETATAVSVAADEVGIAEPADGRCAILFAAAPQIASGKTAEHGGAPGLCALALQRLEYFFDDESQGSVP